MNKILILSAIFFLAACNSDDSGSTQSPAQIIEGKIAGFSWSTSNGGNVSIDGNSSVEFNDFSITFNSGSFTTENWKNAWPANGTYEFTSDEGNSFVRNDGVVVQLQLLNNDNTLRLEFMIENNTFDQGGRGQGLAGNYIFELGAN